MRADVGAPECPAPYSGPVREFAGRQIYDITGNHLPNSPKYSFGVNFSQSFEFENGYEVTPWINVKWQDKMYLTLRNLDNAHISDAQKPRQGGPLFAGECAQAVACRAVRAERDQQGDQKFGTGRQRLCPRLLQRSALHRPAYRRGLLILAKLDT